MEDESVHSSKGNCSCSSVSLQPEKRSSNFGLRMQEIQIKGYLGLFFLMYFQPSGYRQKWLKMIDYFVKFEQRVEKVPTHKVTDRPLGTVLSGGFSWVWFLSNVMATAVTATWETVRNSQCAKVLHFSLHSFVLQITACFHLYELFFRHSDSEVEMTETAGDHWSQLEVKTLQQSQLNDLI